MNDTQKEIHERAQIAYLEFMKTYGEIQRQNKSFESSHIIVTYPSKNQSQPMNQEMINAGGKNISLYIHIPFCKNKCAYCHYISDESDEKTREKYVETLLKEMQITKKAYNIKDQKIRNVHIGGGTPTTLTTQQLTKILVAINENYNTIEGMEVTLESCPNTLMTGIKEDKLEEVIDSGVNRLSIGVQSLQDDVLKIANRSHTANQAIESIHLAREAGFNNINIDVMIGLPGQNTEKQHEDLEKITRIKPESITLYHLRVKSSVPMSDLMNLTSGYFPTTEENMLMTYIHREYMKQEGYLEDPINWFHQKNAKYQQQIDKWTNTTDLLAHGISGYSYLDNTQFYNTCNLSEYQKIIQNKQTPVTHGRKLNQDQQKKRHVIFNLKTNKGVDKQQYISRYNTNPKQDIPKLEELINTKLLTQNKTHIHIPEKQKTITDEIIQKIIHK